jgi:hypothetical protein
MSKERLCPDGGKCHHNCGPEESCWRVNHAGPLSIAKYPNDDWPEEVKKANPPERCAPTIEKSTKKAWVVWINSDLTEGRGRQLPVHICEAEVTAKRLAQGADVQGTDGKVEEVELYQINFKWYGPVDIVSPSHADVRTQLELDKVHAAKKRRDKAIEKAKEAGLSKEDLAALRWTEVEGGSK